MQLNRSIVTIFMVLFIFNACEDEANDPTDTLVFIAQGNDNILKVELLAIDSLVVGLNRIYYRLTDANENVITEADITQKPAMYMMDDRHSCPHVDPSGLANSDDLFEAEIVFTMATGMMGTWDDTVFVTNTATGSNHTVVLENLSVRETNMKKNLVFTDADSNEVIYILTLNDLLIPIVGRNDFILTVAKKESMMSFPSVTDLEITVDPRMPDMGHGSEGNVNPIHTENGKYEGTVVLSMTGYWTVDFTFSLDGELLGTVQYEINF